LYDRKGFAEFSFPKFFACVQVTFFLIREVPGSDWLLAEPNPIEKLGNPG
jgi:hypothetical protein